MSKQLPLEVAVVHETIGVLSTALYEFVRTMENLPEWASGLSSGISQRNGEWVAESPIGRVTIKMAPENQHGVLDHDVTLPDGTTVHNALRVSPAGPGSVVTFVVLRLPGAGDAEFEKDVAHVRSDLKALKSILEK